MAERQGLLRGLHLSLVQVRALEILHLLEEIEKVKDKFFSFRLALLSTGNCIVHKLFPEYAKFLGEEPEPVDMDDSTVLDENTNVDYSGVEWKSPADAKEEYEKLMDHIGSLTKGTIDGEQLVSFPGQGQWR